MRTAQPGRYSGAGCGSNRPLQLYANPPGVAFFTPGVWFNTRNA